MSSGLHRPIVGLNADGQRVFNDPGHLLQRLVLRVSLFEDQTACELFEWRPGVKVEGHLVWQHRSRQHNVIYSAPLDSAHVMTRTGEWLAKEGWPGVAF